MADAALASVPRLPGEGAAPSSPLTGTLWGDKDKRRPLYADLISSGRAPLPSSGRPVESPTTRMLRQGHVFQRADRLLYAAMCQAVMAERQACAALAAKRAPKTAAMILERPALPEWSAG